MTLPQFEVYQDSIISTRFYTHKCDPAAILTDPECGLAPFDYTMNLMLEVTAIKPDNNPIGN